MEADRLWEEVRNISPETLNLRRAYSSPNIMFNVGEITIEEAVRQDRASREFECSQKYVDLEH